LGEIPNVNISGDREIEEKTKELNFIWGRARLVDYVTTFEWRS
jgi:hypothetical protein